MRAQTQIIILIGAFVLAALILKFSFSGERDFENAALGTLTVSYQSQNAQGETIHTIKHNENVVDQMLLEATNSDHVILILGNSQTHSINQKEPGQVVSFLLDAVKNSIAGKIFPKSLPGISISLAL